MIVKAWRIVKAKYALTAFNGQGAKLFGGRWNNKGVPMVYTAGSASLAILEMFVHLESEEPLKGYVLVDASFEDGLIEPVTLSALPKNWRTSPPPASLQRIGDAWVARGQFPVLCVSSAVVPMEQNYLLNPAHPEFNTISIGTPQRVRFDARLIERLQS